MSIGHGASTRCPSPGASLLAPSTLAHKVCRDIKLLSLVPGDTFGVNAQHCGSVPLPPKSR